MKTIYIPSGTKNLAAIFTDVNFRDVGEYWVQLNAGATIMATTPVAVIDGCDDDKVRIHFINALGCIDAINFMIIANDHEPKSDSYELPTKYPLPKQDHAISRFNVKSNDTYTAVTTDYGEQHMDWIDELLDSPIAWMEWKGTQDQPDSYIPIVILDAKSPKQKQEDRFTYETTLTFKLSHERFIIRN